MKTPVRNFKRIMVQLRREGHTLQDIGAKYGVTKERIRQIIGHEGKTPFLYEKMEKFKPVLLGLKKTHTYRQIADMFNVNQNLIINCISKDVKKLGIKYIKYPPGYKRCYGCKQVKALNKFSLRAGKLCRECATKNSSKYANANRKFYLKGGKYYKHTRARGALNQALKKGKIKKGKCILKNKDCFGRIEAHHYLGYEKEHYYDILWTCSQHHEKLDRMSKKEVSALIMM
jgi:hypothetical protein